MELFIAGLVGLVVHYAIMTAAVKDGTAKSYRHAAAQTQLLLAIARKHGVAEDELAAIAASLPPTRAKLPAPSASPK